MELLDIVDEYKVIKSVIVKHGDHQMMSLFDFMCLSNDRLYVRPM